MDGWIDIDRWMDELIDMIYIDAYTVCVCVCVCMYTVTFSSCSCRTVCSIFESE